MEDAVKVSKPWMLWLLLSRREKQWFTGLTVLIFRHDVRNGGDKPYYSYDSVTIGSKPYSE